jgi:hypothetical protein
MNDIASIKKTRGFAVFARGCGAVFSGAGSAVATADDLGRFEGKEKF